MKNILLLVHPLEVVGHEDEEVHVHVEGNLPFVVTHGGVWMGIRAHVACAQVLQTS